MPVTLTEAQLRSLEGSNPEGFTSQQLVAAFEEREVRFSEANLRRYVQLGLVPRSRRIGQKGKHLGSHGVYPARSLRRINTIKKLMAERHTLEEIAESFLSFKDGIEELEEAVEVLFAQFDSKLEGEVAGARRDRLVADLEVIRAAASRLLAELQRFERLLSGPTASGPRGHGGGAAHPTELL